MQTRTVWGAKITSTRTAVGQFKGQFSGAMERYTWVRFAGHWRKCRRGFKRRALCTPDAYPPVMFNPINSAVPPDCISKTRLAPMALSTTAPGTSASMISVRLMQTADPVHMSLVSSYVPAASKILSTALLPTAAVNSPTVLAATSFRCRPRSATSEAVVVMTGPVVRLLTTIAPGALGAKLGGPLRCAPQLPNPARMMRHLRWCRARGDDALLRREERHECAQRLNDPTLAANKAPTVTVSRFCTNGHAR